MTEEKKNEIILKAAIELDPEYKYEIRQGSLGMTLYIKVDNAAEAKAIREKTPMQFEGLRSIVLYDGASPEVDYNTW